MTGLLALLHFCAQIAVIVRALLRPHREPASRMAWVLVILAVPVVGMVAYLLLGEVNLGRNRIERMRAATRRLPPLPPVDADLEPWIMIRRRYAALFRVGASIGDLPPVAGNRAELMADSHATIDRMVADIDAAADHVHLIFYIWLDDTSGLRIAEALKRAAGRGVTCRAMADDLGSRILIRSQHWQDMKDAGVRLAAALPIGNPFLRPLLGRIDLRNHRKIVVIDGTITYCGSQNAADPEFRIKPRFAPWVDAMMRLEGPIARQNQRLFAADWMGHVDEDLGHLFAEPPRPAADPGFLAQAIGTGPTVRNSAMPEMFEALMYAARHELIVTTPYFVPDESMQAALCASGRRGVETTLIVPARNDSRIVASASRSFYDDLLTAGVRIHEYTAGLLHTKSLTIDGHVTLIGSANLDRRSFDLNFENNILLQDAEITGEMRARQLSYLASANRILPHTVRAWSPARRLWYNAVAMFGPVL